VAKLQKLYEKGLLSKDEYDAVMKLRSEGLQQVNINMACENEADLKLFEEGCRIIELLTKVRDFMTLSPNLLEKVRLAKLVLSNPKLLDGTLQFDYKKPFDDLIELVRVPGWWSRRELKRRDNILKLKQSDHHHLNLTPKPTPTKESLRFYDTSFSSSS
jgi:hypothetical protein